MPIGGQLNRQQDMMPNQMLMQQQQNLMEQQRQQYQRQLSLGTNHILRNHIFRLFGPPSPLLRKHIFSTENKQKNALFLTPSPYKCLRNM